MIRPYQAGITPPPAHGPAVRREAPSVESSRILPAAAPLQPVHPIRPAAGYRGGKRNLAGRLVPMIREIPHEIYAEVFVGMGGVFLRRDHRPRAEIINDWSEDVSTFFRILQRHYVPFMDMLRFQLTTRAGFERLLRVDPTTLTDLERAARFLYLQRLAFGGKATQRNFGVSVAQPARFDVTKLAPVLEALHERLASVTIERLPWAKFIDRYDRPETLFYLDPPYYGVEDDYGEGMFSRDEFKAIAERLKRLRGRFLLSLNDTPEVRQIFDGFTLTEVETNYTLSHTTNATKAAELIITK
jgi:DNA adenine methylase